MCFTPRTRMAALFALEISRWLATVPLRVAVPLLKLTWTSVAVTPWAVNSCLIFCSMLLLDAMPVDELGLLIWFDWPLLVYGDVVVDVVLAVEIADDGS